jgi:threonine/homoserine/homoserine lactone efflux protein
MRELLLGVTLGWASGISPGPLNLLVVQAAVRSGATAGALVAVAPLVTDAPIVALSLLLASTVPDTVLTALAIAGGLYLIWLGVVEWRSSAEEAGDPAPGSYLRRGVVANALSPHPWLFWLTVGGPTTVAAWERSASSAVGFVAGFFIVLVGVKIGIAVVVARAGRRLSERGQRIAGRVGGAALAAVGLIVIAGAP